MKNWRQKYRKAFSLAEMSVVLVIIGAIAASALSVAINSDYYTKKNETENKMIRIEEALAGFLKTNRRLPCPADGTLTTVDTNFGLERTGVNITINCTHNFNNSNPTTGVWGGVVPVVTLQLPDDYMFDGWGRRINYVVDANFTRNESSTGVTCSGSGDNCFRGDTAGAITVQDADGGNRTTEAVFVLFSNGENGHGAFPKNGGTRINGFPSGNPYRDATASASEFTNAKYNNAGADTAYSATFVMRDYIRNDDATAAASARTYFDDQVRYMTKYQLVRAAGYLIFEHVCRIADEVLSGADPTCSGATDSSQCTSFATEINAVCLK